ncbi:MAG: DUF2313 domain-containing protein [Eubacteriales bacterium]|nr:DUF2313 domain-containing protein [Eubacteriales bacterium]
MIDLENFPTRQTAIDMMSMISPIYDKAYVAKWIFEVMSAPLSLAQNTVDDLKNQAFPETATWTLPYWERSYGIATNEALSIEERRSQIIRKRNFRKPMNPARIEMLIKELCGREVEFVENVAPHTFEIKIEPGSSSVDLGKVMNLVDEVKQSQKSYRIVFETPISVKIRAEPVKQTFPYRMASEVNKTGRYPHESTIGKISEANIRTMVESGGQEFPYVLSGTRPDVANIGSITSVRLQASILGEGMEFTYPITGNEPETSNLGAVENRGVSAKVEGQAAGIVYKICGARKL